MGFISEFREFINKGNVVDLAVAVILGGAFQKIIDSLVNDMIMPVIATIGDMENIEELKFGPFTYGKFIAASINFLLIALVLFFMIKIMNRTRERIKK